jgi:hypothetical protein
MDDHNLDLENLSQYSKDRLDKELLATQASLEMMYTMHNSLDEPDLEDGGGTPEQQAEFQRLMKIEKAIVAEINKRHMLDVVS